MGDKKSINTKGKKKKTFFLKLKLKNLKIFIIGLLIFATIIGITYISGGFQTFEYLLFYSRNTIDSSVISDGSFPINFTGKDIVSVDSISSKIFILSKKMLTCISEKGKVLFTESISFIEPQMYAGEKYGLIFDRSSSKYLIFDAHGIVYQGNTEGNRHIISAVVDRKGNCALSTKSDDSACRVYMVDKKGEIKYIWSCSDEYVISLDISTDSQRIICGSIGSYSNEVYTKLYCLDIYSQDNCTEYKIDGSACIDVVFTDKNKAAVSCVDKRIIFDLRTADGSPVETNYSGDIVQFCRDFSGNMVVITDKLNSFDVDEITMYDKHNTVVYRSEVSENVIGIRNYGKNVYCLTGDTVIHYGSDGTVEETLTCDVLSDGIVNVKNSVFYYTSESIKNDF